MEMTPDKWKEVKVLFEAALDRPSDCRLQFLEDSCTDDHLRAEVARLLAEYEDAGPTLTSPLDNSAHKIGTELVPSETLAQYQIEEKLGQGGMGAVYRAHDTRLLRTVALKVLAPEHIANAEKRKRLMLEARAASALNHPNIVTVYEIGSDRDVDFIAMEYVQGQSLAHRIPEEGLPLGRALDYATQIAGALAKAHSEGVIHRDLKPANVMLTSDGRVKCWTSGLRSDHRSRSHIVVLGPRVRSAAPSATCRPSRCAVYRSIVGPSPCGQRPPPGWL
jgi:serine/threonine protein kinase